MTSSGASTFLLPLQHKTENHLMNTEFTQNQALFLYNFIKLLQLFFAIILNTSYFCRTPSAPIRARWE